jgi:uncharacterized membrane protein YgdD (TMEM256/DUF423 family)
VTPVLARQVLDDSERRLLFYFAFVALAIGLVSSAVLANSLVDRETIPTAYWDKLLTIAGVAALPIVAMAVLVVRGAMQSGSPVSRWQALVFIVGMVAFVFSIVVILICLFQIVVAADAAQNTTPDAPKDWVIWLTAFGTGVTLSAVAVVVAAAALDKVD